MGLKPRDSQKRSLCSLSLFLCVLLFGFMAVLILLHALCSL